MFLKYNLGSLWARRSATLLTVVSIGATTTVLAGVLALNQGFTRLFEEGGRDDVGIFLRMGATNESESIFPRERADTLMKTIEEIDVDEDGPMASAETFLAVRLNKKGGGGETNVPIRGVQPRSLDLLDDSLEIEGRRFAAGEDELMVGAPLAARIENCELGNAIQLNNLSFKVVGIFTCDGPARSEIWGDLDRLTQALQRPGCTRVVAKLREGTDVTALAEKLEKNPEVPARVFSEKTYLEGQTASLSGAIMGIGWFLGMVMGLAAIFTGINTMLAAVAARTKEIGILLAIGFRPPRIFLSFLTESIVLGLLGGLVGCLFVIPLNGVQTGTTNWDTFSEIAFAFQVTPSVIGTAIVFSMLLGLVAGAVPAWKASRLRPAEGIRRG